MRLPIPKVVDYITNLEHFCNMDRCESTKVVFQFRAGCITIRIRIVALMPIVAPLYIDPLSICFMEDDEDVGPTLVHVTPEDIQWKWETPVLYTKFTTTVQTSRFV